MKFFPANFSSLSQKLKNIGSDPQHGQHLSKKNICISAYPLQLVLIPDSDLGLSFS
jgi:hypothetical protein